MRVALLILLGLAIGVLGTANIMSALAQRNPMPKALMHTMDYHLHQLSHAFKQGRCAAAEIPHHLERIQSTATDIVPVFQIDDKPFTDDAANLQTAVTKGLRADPKSCPALAAAIKPISQTCKSCHEKYR